MEGKVYGFRVKGVEVTKVAEKAEITKVAKMAKIPKRVPGIRMTARHVIWPVTEKAEISIKTARHVMWRSLGQSCSLMICWSKSQGWGNEFGWCSLMMCRSYSLRGVSCVQCRGMGSRRSKWG